MLYSTGRGTLYALIDTFKVNESMVLIKSKQFYYVDGEIESMNSIFNNYFLIGTFFIIRIKLASVDNTAENHMK